MGLNVRQDCVLWNLISVTGLCLMELNVKDRTVCLMGLNVRERTVCLMGLNVRDRTVSYGT